VSASATFDAEQAGRGELGDRTDHRPLGQPRFLDDGRDSGVGVTSLIVGAISDCEQDENL
jgi:hypothetical protein